MPKHNPHLDDETLVEEEQQTKKPPLYKVLMHNDDFTTMEFVVFVLIEIFHKSDAVAEAIMYAVHRKGLGVAGVCDFRGAALTWRAVPAAAFFEACFFAAMVVPLRYNRLPSINDRLAGFFYSNSSSLPRNRRPQRGQCNSSPLSCNANAYVRPHGQASSRDSDPQAMQ